MDVDKCIICDKNARWEWYLRDITTNDHGRYIYVCSTFCFVDWLKRSFKGFFANYNVATAINNVPVVKKTGKTSKYIGVSWNSHLKKWKVGINYRGQRIHLGYFADEIDASKIYTRKKKELSGKK